MKTWAMKKETYKGTIKKINNDNSHTKMSEIQNSNFTIS